MFTSHHNGLRGLAAHVEWQPTKALRLVALLGTLIAVGVAVNATLILVDSSLRHRSIVAGDCSDITEASDRLACWYGLAVQPARQPAKGANAPVLSHSF